MCLVENVGVSEGTAKKEVALRRAYERLLRLLRRPK
jgi:hypothetical protein